MFIAIKTEDGMMKGKISFYCRMLDVSRQALQLKQPEGIHIPSERTVYRIMEEIGFSQKPLYFSYL